MRNQAMAVLAAALLSSGGIAQACDTAVMKVAIAYVVDEQRPERIEAKVTNPLEVRLARTPRLAEVRSNTGHGSVRVELRFDGGATDADLAVVRQRVDEVVVDRDMNVISRSVSLVTSCLPNWPWPDAPAPGAS